ncbi:MAG: hypothetical protein AAF354_08470, partial [Pseudomonadota bacterium]
CQLNFNANSQLDFGISKSCNNSSNQISNEIGDMANKSSTELGDVASKSKGIPSMILPIATTICNNQLEHDDRSSAKLPTNANNNQFGILLSNSKLGIKLHGSGFDFDATRSNDFTAEIQPTEGVNSSIKSSSNASIGNIANTELDDVASKRCSSN